MSCRRSGARCPGSWISLPTTCSNSAKNRTEALVEQIKAALNELGETLGQEEEHVEKLIAERPIAALASAFALGIAIGFMLRRH